MRTKNCLSLDDATRVIAAAKAEAAKNKWAVTIAVVDDSGILLALERLDTATAQSPDIAILKARAAALGRTPSKALEDMVKDRPALGTFPNRAPVQGGLPIFYPEGERVGGVGVLRRQVERRRADSSSWSRRALTSSQTAHRGGEALTIFAVSIRAGRPRTHLPQTRPPSIARRGTG